MAEKTYVIPLRHEWLKVPIFLRTRKAVKAVKNFVKKHSKVEDVRVGKYLNLKLWERGNRHPPHKVQVNVEVITEKKEGREKKRALVELAGAPKEAKREVKKQKLVERLKEKVTGKEEAKQEEVKEEQKALEKQEEKQMEAAKPPMVKQHDLQKKFEVKSVHEKQFTRDRREQRQPKPQAQIVR